MEERGRPPDEKIANGAKDFRPKRKDNVVERGGQGKD